MNNLLKCLYFTIFLIGFNLTNPLLILTSVVVTLSNPIIKKGSTIGNEPYYDCETLPEAVILRNNWKVFREETLNSYKNYSTILGDLYFETLVEKKKEWKKLYIKWHSGIDPLARKLCPRTCQIIEKLPNVKVAMFSVLAPHSKIKIHRGFFKGIIRFHLGLATPNSDDCFIVVDNKKYSWRDGEAVLLDDTFLHYVENNTDQKRIILFCDIVRPTHGYAKILNEFLIKFMAPLSSRKNNQKKVKNIIC